MKFDFSKFGNFGNASSLILLVCCFVYKNEGDIHNKNNVYTCSKKLLRHYCDRQMS